MIAYVGSRTSEYYHASGKGISVYEIDDNNNWDLLQTILCEDNPSYQCMDNNQEFLYSVHGHSTLATSYRIEPDGRLTYLNTVDFGGENPVDITVDRNNRFVIIASLEGGTLFTIERNPDGSLGKTVAHYTYEGKEDGCVSMIHQCLWDRTKEYLFACAQGRVNGYGQIRMLRYHEETGTFSQVNRFMARTWDEPRHAVIHPNNRWLYMVEEKGDKVLYFSINVETGKMQALQELSTLPCTFTGEADASEIMIDPTNSYVVVSNRFADIMAVYRIDEFTGYLQNVWFCDSIAAKPRFCCFAPNGMCYVAGESNHIIVEFQWNAGSGRLKPTGNVIKTHNPVCITFKQ